MKRLSAWQREVAEDFIFLNHQVFQLYVSEVLQSNLSIRSNRNAMLATLVYPVKLALYSVALKGTLNNTRLADP